MTEGGNESCNATRKRVQLSRARCAPGPLDKRSEIVPILSTKTFVSGNCEILVEVAIVRGSLAACARIRGNSNLPFSALFLAQTFCFWAFERTKQRFSLRKASFPTFYANTYISTTIVACYVNNSIVVELEVK